MHEAISRIEVSVVIPIYNEEGNLPELHRRLDAVFQTDLKVTHEIILVDDGSKDTSWALIQGLCQKDPNVKGIKFSRNFGHHIAITAGMDIAKGHAVVLMDGDLQDQPEEIPKLYAQYKQGFDVVVGVRVQKKHSFFKRTTSSIFMYCVNNLLGSKITMDSHIFRIMSRKVVDHLGQFRERDRFITGLISYLGFKQIGVAVRHAPRYAGETKYSFFKLIRLAVNTITAFSYRPLQLASVFGFIVSMVSFLAILYLIIKKIFFGISFVGWTSTVILILFMGGVQMLFLGLLGEYVGRGYAESQKRPLYIIDETLGVANNNG